MEDGVKGGAIATIITATGSANAVTGPDCLLTRDVKPPSCPLTSSPCDVIKGVVHVAWS